MLVHCLKALAFTCIAISATPADSCSYDMSSPFSVRMRSAPVKVGADCSYSDAGVYDGYSGGPATDLGSGRVSQEYMAEWGATVVDCHSQEAIILTGPVTGYDETTCGALSRYGVLVKPDGVLTLKEGKTLTDLAERARSYNVEVDVGATRLTKDIWGKKLWRKDRVDLFCGCKLYYPDSAGAKQ